MWQLTLIPVAGLLNRVRGGFLPTGSTQLARAIFALGMGAMLAFAHLDPWLLLSIPLWFAGEFMPNGDYLGMTSWLQFLEATAVGVANVLLPALLAFWLGYQVATVALMIAGALKGVCYLVAKYIPSKIPGFQQGAEMAELLFGLVLGAGVIL